MPQQKLPESTRKRIQLLGYYIREHRYEAGLTQQEVSSSLGLDRSTLTAIENSKTNYGIQNLILLADFYDVPMSELMEIVE